MAKRSLGYIRRLRPGPILVVVLVVAGLLALHARQQPTALGGWILTGSSSHASPVAAPHTAVTIAAPTTPNFLIQIPSLHENIPLTPVGLNRDGEMAVPANTGYAGWYKYGPQPGQVGNAVVDGHNQLLGRGNGVFWNINKLTAGDDIYIKTGSNVQVHYIVTSNQIYDIANAPLAKIFGPTDKAHLNLITCAGKWDKKLNAYPQRTVVYAELAD